MKLLAAAAVVLIAWFALGPAEAQQTGTQAPASVAITPNMMSELVRNYTQSAQGAVTVLALIVGGIWAYRKFVLRQERYPHIETSADIHFIGKHADYWIIELIAYVENKGAAQHKMSKFDFDLYHLLPNDNLQDSKAFGGQVEFPHITKQGSFLSTKYRFFFVDPGVKAKYSYVTRAPADAQMLIFHWWFTYSDGRQYGHAAEITKLVPNEDTSRATVSTV